MDDITLLAMAPSGETFFARDRSGRVWLYQPLGAGAPEVVDEDLAERAIADHGFDRIGQGFRTWQALDDFRQVHAERLAPRVKLDRNDLDLDDVARFLAVAQRWATEGEGPRARKLLLRLLRVPAVRAD